MKSAKVLTSVTNDAPQILTALRAQMVAENPSFENRLPQVTQDNIREFGTAVLDYQPTQNAFVDTLVNLIGRVWITYRLFTNPMRVLKKGILEYGDTVELVYTNLAKAVFTLGISRFIHSSSACAGSNWCALARLV